MTRRGETLELAVLGLLHESPMHGYELRKRLTVVLGWGRVLSYGSLYPALKKMLRAGWISEYVAATEPVKVRASGKAVAKGTKNTSASRRQRIVYELTPAGDEHFARLMSDAGPASWEDGDFDVRFAFFGRTDPGIRLRILEGRRTRLTERMETIRLSFARARERMDEYTLELQRHGLEQVEREVHWLDGLIDNERGQRRARPTGTGRPADADRINAADGDAIAAPTTEKERG